MILTPQEIGRSRNAAALVKQYLRDFKKSNYDVDSNFTKMDDAGTWNYFLSFLRKNGYYEKNPTF
jgi:protein-tyrosine-phosphatase